MNLVLAYLKTLADYVSIKHCDVVEVIEDTEEEFAEVGFSFNVKSKILSERLRNYLELRQELEDILGFIDEMISNIEKN